MTRSMVVVGAGVMGRGIARLFADAGIEVALLVRRPTDFSHPNVTVVQELPAAVPDLVLETIIEEAEAKQAVYAAVEDAYGGAPALATNTSGLALEVLAASLRYPQRFLGLHFFMPAELFPMIEVVPTPATEPSAVAAAVSAVERSHREPVLLGRPVIGYVINRLQHSILHEAYHMIEAGIASADTIDRVAKKLLGPRMCVTGLLEQKDIGGLEMHVHAQRSIVPALAHTGVPTQIIEDMLARGDVGIRSGRGFYDWNGVDPELVSKGARERLIRLLRFLTDELGEPDPASVPNAAVSQAAAS